jgi:hypothetical protein
MKRLPLILAALLILVACALITPFLFCIWFLGGNQPFKRIGDAMNKIIFS